MILIETKRLVVRQFKPKDWRDLHEYLSKESVLEYEPGTVSNEEECKSIAKERSKANLFWAVCLKDTNKMIGHVYFSQKDPREFLTWMIGYIFNPDYYGQGYATEACQRILKYGFEELGARRVIALCNPENIASWRLLERLSMRREGTFMKEVFFNRLYAHRNNLRFPYVELSYNNTESYVLLNQHSEFMQYFFSVETTARLAELCESYTACLVTPSVARYAHNLNKNIVLFERDSRFRENGGLKFVKYDLKKGLTKLLQNKYMKKFDIVVCDPPFDISLDILASDIDELLKTDNKSVAYVIFPSSRETHLKNAMMRKGLNLNEVDEKIGIVYAKPPKLVRVHGRDAIQLYKFTYKPLLSLREPRE